MTLGQHAPARGAAPDRLCHNDACRHQALIDVSSYPDDVEVPWFGGKVVCAKSGRAVGASTCGRTGMRRRARLMIGPADRLCRAETNDC
jgi:hypothetical protein